LVRRKTKEKAGGRGADRMCERGRRAAGQDKLFIVSAHLSYAFVSCDEEAVLIT